jgi:hypothetical protein
LDTIDDARRAAELFRPLGSHTPLVSGTVVEVTVDNGPESAMAGLRFLDQAGIVPATFTLREPSLDDVFLALTGRRTENESDQDGDPAVGGGGRGRRRGSPAMETVGMGELS